MFRTGKCPHCNRVLSNIRIEDIDIIEGLRSKYHGMSLVCLLFEKVLQVALNQFAYKRDHSRMVGRHVGWRLSGRTADRSGAWERPPRALTHLPAVSRSIHTELKSPKNHPS